MKGRKRHLLVDTLGLPLSTYVTPAGAQDRVGARLLLAGLEWLEPRPEKIWADGAYGGEPLTSLPGVMVSMFSRRETNSTPRSRSPSLTDEEKDLLDFVINSSASKNWDDFIKLVYSTYPIVTQERFAKLDLIALACEYEKSIPLLES